MKTNALDRTSLKLSQIVDLLLLNGTLTKCPGLAHGKMGIAGIGPFCKSFRKVELDPAPF